MDDLDFYRGTEVPLPDDLPTDPAELARLAGGVIVHRDWTQAFGFDLPEARRAEADTRDIAAILRLIGPLTPQEPSARFAGTCRDFTVLLVTLLRHAGHAARARAGFAGYFHADGFHDDHWVAEYWTGTAWRLMDAQLAGTPAEIFAPSVDPYDVPRDAFLVGGQAWLDCRAGRRDPSQFGVKYADLSGMWEIQGNVIRDLAALNRVDTLPWDSWGLIGEHYDTLSVPDRTRLDAAAQVSVDGGPLLVAQNVYAGDPGLHNPSVAAS